MLDKVLGSRENRWVKFVVKKFFKGRLSANQLTLIGLFLGFSSAVLIFILGFLDIVPQMQQNLNIFWQLLKNEGFSVAFSPSSYMEENRLVNSWNSGDTLLLVAAFLMSLSFLFDVFDGTLARLEGTTDYGGVLDIFCDRFVEVILLIAIVFLNSDVLALPGVLALGATVLCITIFLLVGGKVNAQDVEDMSEKKKVIYYAGGIMERTETFIFIILSLILKPWRAFLLYLFALLVLITALQRLIHARKLLKI